VCYPVSIGVAMFNGFLCPCYDLYLFSFPGVHI